MKKNIFYFLLISCLLNFNNYKFLIASPVDLAEPIVDINPKTYNSSLQLAQKYIPLFYEAVKEVLGEEGSKQFFTNWEIEDFLNFIIKMQNINYNLLYGTIGEILGAIKLKQYVLKTLQDKKTPTNNIIFISDLTLDPQKYISGFQNKGISQNRHDGLVFSITKKGELIIYFVFESKMSGGYDVRQANGVFERWKKRGVFIGKTYFPNYKTYFALPVKGQNKYKTINISSIKEFNIFEQITILTSCIPSQNTTNNIINTTPLDLDIGYSADDIRKIITNFQIKIQQASTNINDISQSALQTISKDILARIDEETPQITDNIASTNFSAIMDPEQLTKQPTLNAKKNMIMLYLLIDHLGMQHIQSIINSHLHCSRLSPCGKLMNKLSTIQPSTTY